VQAGPSASANSARPGGSYVTAVIPKRSVGILSLLDRSWTMKTRSLERMPMARPSSKMTLSRGAGCSWPREVTVSSPAITKMAKSVCFSVNATTRLSMVVGPGGKAFVHLLISQRCSRFWWTASNTFSPSREDPINARGLRVLVIISLFMVSHLRKMIATKVNKAKELAGALEESNCEG